MKTITGFMNYRMSPLVVAGAFCCQVMGADLTLATGGRVSVELIFSDATFRNTLSVVSPAVGTTLSGCELEPATGLSGVPVLSEKISQRGCRVDLDADTGTAGIQPFAAGTTFRFGFCAQTDADPDCEFVWSSDPASNADGFDHVMTTPLRAADYPGRIFQLAWEDQTGGGDMDFNDLVAVLRVDIDSDSDGLWDDWEQYGIDTDGNGTIDLDLPALGADPMHKDIFLEIDYMDCSVAGGDCAAGDTHSHRPKMAAVNAVVQAFANAMVPNPDGSTGIDLHIDVSNAVAHADFMDIPGPCGGSPLPAGIADFDAIKADPANYGPTNPRRYAYRYQLFGHRRGPATASSGCSELPGNDTIVTLGDWNTRCISPGPDNMLDSTAGGDDVAVMSTSPFIGAGPDLVCDTTAVADDIQRVAVGSAPTADLDGDGLDDRTVGTVMQQGGTLMHEFGHNLQLCHGGQYDTPGFTQCNTNYKPNYLSIMNYFFQTRGIPPNDPDGTGPLTARLDYSKPALPSLDENAALNEPAGISDGTDSTRYSCPGGGINIVPGSGAIDWDCDGDNTETGVTADINRGQGLTTLAGFDDWASLRYDFQSTAGFQDGLHPETVDFVELEYTAVLQIPVMVQIDIKPYTDTNSVNSDSKGKITVVILSAYDFSAPGEVDRSTLTFGRTGDEASLAFCNPDPEDVNRDGRPDLICHFDTQLAGFRADSILGTLRGMTVEGDAFTATDSVRIVPPR
jgi:hypothetical protein